MSSPLWIVLFQNHASQQIEQYTESSIANDRGIVSGYFRNKDASKEKREAAETLKKALTQATNLQECKVAIASFKSANLTIATKYTVGIGDANTYAEIIEALATYAEQLCSQFKMDDLTPDTYKTNVGLAVAVSCFDYLLAKHILKQYSEKFKSSAVSSYFYDNKVTLEKEIQIKHIFNELAEFDQKFSEKNSKDYYYQLLGLLEQLQSQLHEPSNIVATLLSMLNIKFYGLDISLSPNAISSAGSLNEIIKQYEEIITGEITKLIKQNPSNSNFAYITEATPKDQEDVPSPNSESDSSDEKKEKNHTVAAPESAPSPAQIMAKQGTAVSAPQSQQELSKGQKKKLRQKQKAEEAKQAASGTVLGAR